MEKQPTISFVGGLVLFVGATSIGILDALRRLDFLQKSHPTVYAGITSRPSMLAVGLAGIASMLWSGWQFHQKRIAAVAPEQSPVPSPSEAYRQIVSDSNVSGDVRMVGTVGRDYIEKQEIHHAGPLSEAQP